MDLSGAGLRRAAVWPQITPAGYVPHALHGEAALWREKNCYIDLWIAVLQARGLEPLALWPFTLALDFEGDQWTFFKPPHTELRRLYGIDVQELTPWRPLAELAIEHLSAGRLIATEADSFWLPDVAGTDYRTAHAKTTIVFNTIDLDARRLGYFHNAGYFELADDDFDGVLQSGPLPLFAEFIRTDRIVARAPAELRALAATHLAEHLAWRPATNPVQRFAERVAADLPLLRERGLAHYHAWAFAGVRQLGAAFELAAAGLRWQGPELPGQAEAAAAFDEIAQTAKTLILKMARAVASPRPTELAPLLDTAARAWQRGMTALG